MTSRCGSIQRFWAGEISLYADRFVKLIELLLEDMEESVVVGPEDSVVGGNGFVEIVEEFGYSRFVERFCGDAQSELLDVTSVDDLLVLPGQR